MVKGFKVLLVGLLFIGIFFLVGFGLLASGEETWFGFWVISALGGLVGIVCILIKLVDKLRAFEEADD